MFRLFKSKRDLFRQQDITLIPRNRGSKLERFDITKSAST